MIRDITDPTGQGLFSKCARNHACKTVKSRPRTAGNSHLKETNYSVDASRKEKSKNQHSKTMFDKQQSRQQRLKRYRKEQTPAVGQYNPVIKKQSKLVWDILKAYHNTYKKPDLKNSKTQPKSQPIHHPENGHLSVHKQTEVLEQNLVSQQQGNYKKETQPNNNSNQKYQLISPQPKKSKNKPIHFYSQQSQSPPKHLNTLVNMSRMTGRQDTVGRSPTQNSGVANNTEFTTSVDFKKQSNKNTIINFQTQLSRDYIQTRSKKTPSQDYTYDYTVVKPNKNFVLKFNLTQGRNRPKRPSGAYSYTHYDYNSYVWKKKSTIYPNTKNSMIDFQKQVGRR